MEAPETNQPLDMVEKHHTPEPLNMESLQWYKISSARDLEIMTNGSGELFVKINGSQVRISPKPRGFDITDWNSPGKFRLHNGISVETD